MQKVSQTYSQRKIHREQGMKGKGWFKSWRVPVGEDSEYKGDYTVGDMPLVWVVWTIYWTHKSWDLTQGSETPLDGCRVMWTNKRSVGSLESHLQEHVLRGLLPSHKEENRWRPHLWMPVFPTTAQLTHALLTPCGRSALEQGLPWPGRQLGCGKQGCIRPRVACSWKSRGHAHGGHLHRQSIRSPDLWWRADCHSRRPSMGPESMRASPAQ